MKSYFAKKIFPRNPPKSLTRETKLPQKNLYMPPDWDKGKRSGVCYAYLIYRSPEKKRKWAKKCCSKGYSHFGLHSAHYMEKFQDVKPGSKFYGSVNSKRIHHPLAFVTGRLLGYEFPRKGIFLQRAVV